MKKTLFAAAAFVGLALVGGGCSHPLAGAAPDNTDYDSIHPTRAGLCSTDPLWPRLSEFCNRDNPYDDSGSNGPIEVVILPAP